ncbi:MAG: S-layer homology domain-containing protein [Clostridiales Family XIII bacterium]|jgi:hypothetical protein|nr:S-layer homology domain-containing protein [Clostridiales Family XIII bacterium]
MFKRKAIGIGFSQAGPRGGLLALLPAVLIALAFSPAFAISAWGDTDITDRFTDPNFKAAVYETIGKSAPALILDSDVSGITSLDVSDRGIQSLAGIEYFTALELFRCYYNQLTALDVRNNTALMYLYCDNNQLTALDVRNNTALKGLSCHDNQLTALDVNNNTALIRLWCDNNQLTTLDVRNNTALEALECDGNQLTELDVRNNTALEYLYCYGNQLTELDVSNNTALTWLYCYDNQLTALDVSGLTALAYLDCRENYLTGVVGYANPPTTSFSFSPQKDPSTAPPVPLKSISLDHASATLTTGASLKLNVSYNPANATDDRTVTWASSDPGVAAVDAQGLVTASLTVTGSAVITAWVGGFTASCTVTVVEPSTAPPSGGDPSGSGPSGGGVVPAAPAAEEEKQEEAQTPADAASAEPIAALRDVSASDWYYENVKFVVDSGLFRGVSETAFAPDAQMTRAMLATVLHRLAVEPAAPGGVGFADVPAGKWFTDAVAWASANGIVGGYSESVFGADDAVTREQIAVLLYRYANLMGMDTSAAADLSAYADADAISEWAREAMAWANATGLITGRGADTLAPADTATRAEVATVLHRFARATQTQ